MTNFTGYNKARVEAIRGTIDTCYKEVTTLISENIHTTLVQPMSTKWYAPEAKTEFADIKKNVISMEESLQPAYDAFRLWVQQMGESWAENTGGEKPKLDQLPTHSKDFDVTKIKDKDPDGNVQLAETEAKAIADEVKNLRAKIIKEVEAKHNALTADTAFIGRGQGAAATACFVKVVDAITQLLTTIGTIGSRIEKYADKYKEVAEKVNDEFKYASVSVSSN